MSRTECGGRRREHGLRSHDCKEGVWPMRARARWIPRGNHLKLAPSPTGRPGGKYTGSEGTKSTVRDPDGMPSYLGECELCLEVPKSTDESYCCGTAPTLVSGC